MARAVSSIESHPEGMTVESRVAEGTESITGLSSSVTGLARRRGSADVSRAEVMVSESIRATATSGSVDRWITYVKNADVISVSSIRLVLSVPTVTTVLCSRA